MGKNAEPYEDNCECQLNYIRVNYRLLPSSKSGPLSPRNEEDEGIDDLDLGVVETPEESRPRIPSQIQGHQCGECVICAVKQQTRGLHHNRQVSDPPVALALHGAARTIQLLASGPASTGRLSTNEL